MFFMPTSHGQSTVIRADRVALILVAPVPQYQYKHNSYTITDWKKSDPIR